MSDFFKMGVLAFVVVGLVTALGLLLASCEEQAPADQTGIELDIDRKKTRAPLKPAKPAPAPKTKKASKQ